MRNIGRLNVTKHAICHEWRVVLLFLHLTNVIVKIDLNKIDIFNILIKMGKNSCLSVFKSINIKIDMNIYINTRYNKYKKKYEFAFIIQERNN